MSIYSLILLFLFLTSCSKCQMEYKTQRNVQTKWSIIPTIHLFDLLLLILTYYTVSPVFTACNCLLAFGFDFLSLSLSLQWPCHFLSPDWVFFMFDSSHWIELITLLYRARVKQCKQRHTQARPHYTTVKPISKSQDIMSRSGSLCRSGSFPLRVPLMGNILCVL
jgi:hypothetical protein